MEKEPSEIPAGALFTATSGEYSDYSISGVFRAIAALNPLALRDEFLAEHPDQKAPYRFNESAFLGWLTRRGLIETVECFELHLGDYADHEMELSRLT